MSILKSIGAIAGGAGGTALDFAQGRYFAKRSEKFSRTAMQNRLQWTMEDARKAGLNPVYTASGGAPVASAGMQKSSSGSSGVNATTASQLSLQKKQANLLDAQASTEAERRRSEFNRASLLAANSNSAHYQAIIDREVAKHFAKPGIKSNMLSLGRAASPAANTAATLGRLILTRGRK